MISKAAVRPIHIFALQALVLTLLLGMWPTPKELFPALFHAHANGVFSLRPQHPLAFTAVDQPPGGEADTEMAGFEDGSPLWVARYSVNRIAYWPLAALLAMLLATPMAPRRRLLAVSVGVLLLDAFTLGRIAVAAEYAYLQAALGAGASAQGMLHLLLRVGSESLTATVPSMASVFAIWALVARPTRTIELGATRRFFASDHRPRQTGSS